MRPEKNLPSIALFAELDVLLDTRLGLLLSKWPGVVPDLLMNGYYDRIVERFPGVPFEEFNEAYKNRDKSVLFKSFKTGFCKVAIDFANGVIENTIGTPHHGKPKLIVNIHPYVLNEDEVTLIIKAIALATRKLLDIEIVNMSYDEITPSWLSSNCAAVCMYRYPDWIESQFGKYDSIPMKEWVVIPDVTLLAPQTSYVDLKTIGVETVEKMEKAKEYIKPFIGIEYIPVETICPIVRLPFPDKEEQSKKKPA